MEDDNQLPFKAKKGRSGLGERSCILSSIKAEQELPIPAYNSRDVRRWA